MGQGSIIGYEINEKTCQISFYNDKEMEPQTLEVDSDNFQIPLIIGKLRDTWAYGKEAKRLATLKEGFTVARLLSRSLADEKIEFGDETYDAVWLLSQFIQMSLQSFPEIDGIVFTVPVLTEELAQMLRKIALRMKIDKRHIFIQDYKESFCNTYLKNTIYSQQEIPKLKKETLTQINAQYPFVLPTDHKVQDLLCNLFYLNLYLNLEHGSEDENMNVTLFRDAIWNQVIRNDFQQYNNLPVKREAFVQRMVSDMMAHERYTYSLKATDDFETVSALESSGIIIPYQENRKNWMMSHYEYE